MTKREKLVEKICNEAQLSFEEVKNLLIGLGFSHRQSGSHVTFQKGIENITLVAKTPVKDVYLRRLCAMLRRLGY